jgi:hypothetical protein
MSREMTPEPDEFDLPQSLLDDLRWAYGRRQQIPSGVDEAVLSVARAKFDQRRRLRLIARWGTGLAAGLAAVVALAVILHRPPAPTKTIAKGDVNADGQVNMVDVLALAKRVASGEKPEQSWDVNGDGKVDQSDVQALATAAVSLKQAGLAKRSLPKFDELGLERRTGLASTPPAKSPLAKAGPVAISEGRR